MSRKLFAICSAASLVLVAGCSGAEDGPSGSSSAAGSSTTKQTVVKLVTHDSWVAPKPLLAEFTKATGYQVKVIASGDAGKLANSIVLAKGKPVGDVTFGIDNTFATRVSSSGALAPYASAKLPQGADKYALTDADAAKQLTPIDFGDVCVNVDDAWFAKNKKTPPTSLDDLTKPAYKNLFVTPGAATSSPGMAFLLATIAKYGESGWQGYWKKLMANGAKVTAGWSDAWGVDYTAGGGNGTRPIVLSYDSSPADTKQKSSALLNSCFRSVEYAGVLQGAQNPAGAKAFIDFMLGKSFQTALPTNMYVFPVDPSIPLPAAWKSAVKVPGKPLDVAPATITAKRDGWLRQWQDVTSN